MTTAGAGTINLTTGSAGVIVKPTTDNGAAFQVQNAAGSYIFNVNTVFGLTNIGLLNIGIGTKTHQEVKSSRQQRTERLALAHRVRVE